MSIRPPESAAGAVASSAEATEPRNRMASLCTPIMIGNRQLPTRCFLAPLAGYTHLAFRLALRELGGLGLATTDLVQATMLLSETRKSMELVATCPDDRPLSVQIFSGKTEELVRAAQWLEKRGYAGVDINMGCPMGKINGGGGGARLLCNGRQACDTVAQVVQAVDLPVTVKMRLGWDRDNISAPALAREFEQVGVAAITLHGRTRAQGFHGHVDLESIGETVRAVQQIPVIGNGDLRSVDDIHTMLRVTGCAAVSIGRGAMLDPWLFRKVQQAARGDTPADPSAEEQIHFLERHFQLMTQQHGDYSCTLFRKFAGWYGARLGIPEDLEDRLRRQTSIQEFQDIVQLIRERHGTRKSTTPTALVKVPNGPVERW